MRTMRKPMKSGELKQEGGDECGPLRHCAPMDFGGMGSKKGQLVSGMRWVGVSN
jgi:hypothetical protein